MEERPELFAGQLQQLRARQEIGLGEGETVGELEPNIQLLPAPALGVLLADLRLPKLSGTEAADARV